MHTCCVVGGGACVQFHVVRPLLKIEVSSETLHPHITITHMHSFKSCYGITIPLSRIHSQHDKFYTCTHMTVCYCVITSRNYKINY